MVLHVDLSGSGQVVQLRSLLIPARVVLYGMEVEGLGQMLTSKRLVITDSSWYVNINFIPLFFPMNPVE